MKAKFKIVLFAIIVFLGGVSASAVTKFDNETLKYVITYKWGLITKDSGEATMTLKNQGNKYNITLTGKTRPWADGLYKVRDTLISVMDKTKFRPISYTKIAHEGGDFSKDMIVYSYSGNQVKGQGTSLMKKKKGNPSTKDLDLTGKGDTFDMLSVFYWIRSFDPATMTEGKKITATLFSGSQEETMTVWKVGEGIVKMRDGTKREAWHLKFTFTSKGGKKTSDDLDVWLSKDDRRIPLEIKGKLPIGHASAYLIN